jgi:putative hydrolases of HD superfamily
MNLDTLVEFLSNAGRLKNIPRTGWLESGVKDSESVADHVYRTCLTAMVLSDIHGFDTCKVIRMALLHDLAEIKMGDITPSRKQENHKDLENQAMSEILAGLNDNQKALYWDIWLEYQQGISSEALLVHDADKIEMILQASEYKNSTNARLDRFWHVMVSPMNIELVEKIKEKKL